MKNEQRRIQQVIGYRLGLKKMSMMQRIAFMGDYLRENGIECNKENREKEWVKVFGITMEEDIKSIVKEIKSVVK